MHGTIEAPSAPQPKRTPKLLLAFFLALVVMAYVIEIIDPAPMSVEAFVASP